MKLFEVPVTWQMGGFFKVVANSKEEAIRMVEEDIDDVYPIEAAEDSEYIDDSFCVNKDCIMCLGDGFDK